MFTRSLGIATLLLVCAALVSSLASATPMLLTFDIVAQAGSTGSGSGYAVVDSSLLAPSTTTIDDFPNLLDWSVSLTGLSSTPSSTTFGLADLFSWILQTDAAGQVVDFNFRTFAQNADGYGLNATLPTVVDLCIGATGEACEGGRNLGRYDIVNYQASPVPEPATLSLVSAVLILGIWFKFRSRRVGC